MRIPFAVSLASLTTLLLTAGSLAQGASKSDAPTAPPAQTTSPDRDAHDIVHGDCARARAAGKTCVLNMGGETVGGTGIDPEGSITLFRMFGTHDSLIHVRRDFIPEIVKSAEDL